MNKFAELKSLVDIQRVAQHYGVKLNRHGKAFCPFHSEKIPSFSIHKEKNIFKCFSCGKSGSIIDLVSHMFGLNALDASKKINNDFNLRLDFEKFDSRQISDYKRKKELEEQFNNWIKDAEDLLCEYYKYLRFYCEDLEEIYHNIDKIGYYLDLLINADNDGKIWFWKNCKGMVNKIAELSRQINDRGIRAV